MGTRNIDGHAVTYPLDPTRWWPHAGVLDDKEDETGGRWACSCYYFDATKCAPDIMNICQVLGDTVQYLEKGAGSLPTNA
jgi:hypothetical protein